MASISTVHSIRQMRKRGDSISAIARKTGLSRNTVYAELALALGKASRERALEAAMRDIARNDLVILDEFGYVPLDLDSARLLFQVVSDCYERRSLVITTNIEFSKWGTVPGDDKMAAAMVDRIVHHGRLVEFTGANHRMEASLMLGKAVE